MDRRAAPVANHLIFNKAERRWDVQWEGGERERGRKGDGENGRQREWETGEVETGKVAFSKVTEVVKSIASAQWFLPLEIPEDLECGRRKYLGTYLFYGNDDVGRVAFPTLAEFVLHQSLSRAYSFSARIS